MVNMTKKKKLKTYKFDTTAFGTDAWKANDEYTADEDIVVLGFTVSMIGRGLDGAIGITKSGTVNPSIPRQDDVLHYQENAGTSGPAANVLSHADKFFPEDCRPELDKGEKLYLWGESMDTNIGHALMYFYEK